VCRRTRSGSSPFLQVTLGGLTATGVLQSIPMIVIENRPRSVRYCKRLGQLHNYHDWIRCNQRSMRHLDNACSAGARKLVYWLARVSSRVVKPRARAWPDRGGGDPGTTSGERWPARLVSTAENGSHCCPSRLSGSASLRGSCQAWRRLCVPTRALLPIVENGLQARCAGGSVVELSEIS
jgi:hypothetical protein